MLIDVQTVHGTRKVRVCDYCRCVCIPSGRFCSGRCARAYQEMTDAKRVAKCFACQQEADLVMKRDDGLIVPFCKGCATDFLEMASVKNPNGVLTLWFRDESDFQAVRNIQLQDFN